MEQAEEPQQRRLHLLCRLDLYRHSPQALLQVDTPTPTTTATKSDPLHLPTAAPCTMPPKRSAATASASGPKLLIVESPAKCKKIQEILGAGWRVRATMGHIRALKEDLTAIGFRTTWTPTYETIGTKAEAIAALRREAAAASAVYLASDDDREGEAIAWHTCILLGLDPATTPRVTFHEITASAITEAVASPGRIDLHKFNAQQARSMLDMLIGFTLSPCLWRGVGNKPGLSAGRCQTPALRILYDRDREIEGHTASLSWRVTATTATTAAAEPLVWRATEDAPTEAAATALLSRLAPAPNSLTITARQERTATSAAPAPFITSTLQQEASSRLSLNPKATMRAAQNLYEAGHITYMRTDNAVLSEEAKAEVAALVTARWGAEYLAPAEEAKKKVVRRKKAAAPAGGAGAGAGAGATPPEAQAAHEGIRPTHLETTDLPDQGPTEQRLYALIWTRTVQSQMAPERRDVVKLTATPTAAPEAATFTTDWDRQAFAGWRILEAERRAEALAADDAAFTARASLIAGQALPWQALPWQSITASEVRTSAPSRYTEASLIRELEARGIGRPSTYATLVETVLDRGYVEKANIPATPVTLRSLTLTAGAATPIAATRTERAGAERDKLRTTALGRTVIEWLLANFEDMVAYDFTALMETQLDEVAKGTRLWQTLLTDTWARYESRYDAIMTAPAAARGAGAGAGTGTSSSRVAEFGDGYKMVISKRGPLFVYEPPGGGTARFASVPSSLSITTATRADAEAAFTAATAAATGETLGDLDGEPVIRRSGRFGPYVTWRGHSLNCKSTDTLSDLSERLLAKADPATAAAAVDHLVGGYRIRRGPYGLYMFKVTTGTKKPIFVGIPESTPWATLTPETADQVYKLATATKKAAAATKKKGAAE
jgi:DNA topoisomerase-1